MGMSKSENLEARKPWKTSLIIKLVGQKIGYHYLSKRLLAMWKPQSVFTLTNLTNDFYIVKFTSKDDYNNAILKGPWIIGDHYLHVQRWHSNFMADDEGNQITLVLVCFPILSIEYYTTQWLPGLEINVAAH